MSLSNILQHVKRKGQIQSRNDNGTKSLGNTDGQLSSLNNQSARNYRSGEQKEVDPVVAKLKAARKLEREKKEQEMREKKGLLPKKTNTTTRNPNQPRSMDAKKKNLVNINNNKARSMSPFIPSNLSKPVKKMNFNDLMKKASKIDQSKLSVSIKPKAKSHESNLTQSKYRPTSRGASAPTDNRKNAVQRKDTMSKSPNRHISNSTKQQQIAPLPIRKPSSKLEERLKSSGKTKASLNSKYGETRNNYSAYDDYDEDSESFIVSDEEEADYHNTHAPDYDRDEIWAIFNKGKKRSYYDRYDEDSADDMEATGAEILEEEMRSKRNAELEDRRELEEEQRLAALKRAKKMTNK